VRLVVGEKSFCLLAREAKRQTSVVAGVTRISKIDIRPATDCVGGRPYFDISVNRGSAQHRV
jgi:hypothetical protein